MKGHRINRVGQYVRLLRETPGEVEELLHPAHEVTGGEVGAVEDPVQVVESKKSKKDEAA